MIKYRAIQFLPEGHPMKVAFLKELERESEQECAEESFANLDDEESQAYFDRYIAGDR